MKLEGFYSYRNGSPLIFGLYDGERFKPFVKGFLYLDPYYFNNCNRPSVFEGFAKFKSYALLVDFSR